MPATPAGFDPATYTSDNTSSFFLGQELTHGNRTFRFVRNSTDATIARGDVLVRASASSWVVTAVGGASQLAGVVCGVSDTTASVLVNKYFFMLTRGDHYLVKGVATVTVGRRQTASGTAASGTNVTNAYDHSFGVALTTLSGGLYGVLVDV